MPQSGEVSFSICTKCVLAVFWSTTEKGIMLRITMRVSTEISYIANFESVICLNV
jgi:hypothetical protein